MGLDPPSILFTSTHVKPLVNDLGLASERHLWVYLKLTMVRDDEAG